jgi:TolB-like protein/tetratricopeptide (TPR) repeat protein
MSLRLKQFYSFGPFQIDVYTRLLLRDGVVVPISERLFDILLTLVCRKGETVDKIEIIREVWRAEPAEENALTFHIFKLRKLLGETPAQPRYVATVPGRGYRFVAEVKEVWEESNTTPATSVAVLPFKPLSPNTDEYLGFGMADALINRLARIRRITVRPSQAVGYCAPDGDIFAAGQRLRVESVLEGSVRRLGERIQIAVQLVSVRDRLPLWTDRFDESFGDIFTVEDWISEQVARVLAPSLTEDDRERLIKHSTESTEAYQEYLKGRYHWNKRTEEGTRRGIEHFERAISIDPVYAQAYAGLADCYSLLSFYSVIPPGESFTRSKEAATRAIELDEGLAEAHASLGYAKLYYDWDWVGAEKEFRRAISLDPNCATAHHWYHEFLLTMGWFDEAMSEVKRAHELDPISPAINAALVLPLVHAGQYDKAIEQLKAVIDLDPDFYRSHLFLGAAYTQKREFAKAITEFQIAVILSDGSTRALAALGYAYAVSGRRQEALNVLEDLNKRSRERFVSPYAMAVVHAGLGDKDQAFEWLEHAYNQRDEWLVRLKIAPELVSLRSDQRFTELLWRIGLAP